MRSGLGEDEYIPSPEKSRRSRLLGYPWRVVLIREDDPASGIIAVDIYDDVVLGRSNSEDDAEAPDIDLTPFGAQELGTSRRHAILRPMVDELILVDLDSTNGTHVNGTPQEAHTARALDHNDTLSLGKLKLTLKVVSQPAGPAL